MGSTVADSSNTLSTDVLIKVVIKVGVGVGVVRVIRVIRVIGIVVGQLVRLLI